MSQVQRLDLHLHTTHSDGSLPPAEVVRLAHKANVRALAITDHDILTGLPEAMETGQALAIEVVPGVEISSRYLDSELHILGYFFDWHDPTFTKHLANLRASRHARNPQIIQKLNDLGLAITYDEVIEKARTESIGRPHIAQVMVEKGYVRSPKEAFERYLAGGKPAYVPRELPTPETAIHWIRAAKGVPVLAHPMWAPVSGTALIDLLKSLKDAGLVGIEAHYSTHKPKDTGEYLALAEQVGLLPSGGSDFHGITKPDIDVGVGRGDLKVSMALLEPLREASVRL